jgi:hypothetical protein
MLLSILTDRSDPLKIPVVAIPYFFVKILIILFLILTAQVLSCCHFLASHDFTF